MARRLNTKLLAILGGTIIFIVVGLFGGAYYYRLHVAANAARNALAFFEEGKYSEAIELFPKAVRRKQFANDIDLMLTASKAHARIVVTTRSDAQSNLGHRMEWLRRAIRVDPYDGEALQERMDLEMRFGTELEQPSAWNSMFTQTQALVEIYPDLLLAIKYRGISQVNRMRISTTNVEKLEREQARKDLEIVRSNDQFADDGEVIEYLATWCGVEAAIALREGASEQDVEPLRNEGLALTSQSVQRHPDDLKRLIAHIQVLAICNRMDAVAPFLEQLGKLLEEPKDLRPALVLRGLRYILAGAQLPQAEDDTRTREEYRLALLDHSAEICRRAIDAHPTNLLLKVQLADLYVKQNRLDDGAQLCKETWDSSLEGTPLDFLIRSFARNQSGLSYLRLRMSQIEALKDPAQKADEAAVVAKQLEQIKEELGELPRVTMLEAQLAEIRHERIKATQKYDEVLTNLGTMDTRTLLRSAESRLKMNEWGAAAENYEQVLKTRPEMYRVRLRLIEIYMRGKRLEQAEEHFAYLSSEANDIENDFLDRIEITLLLHQKAWDAADEKLKSFDVTGHPSTAITVAGLYYIAGKKNKGRTVMAKTFDRHTDNVQVAIRLIQMTEDQDAQLAIVEKCRNAGGNVETLDTIQRKIEGTFEMDEAIVSSDVDEESPQSLARAEYTRLADDNKRRKAREALSKLDFDEPANASMLWDLLIERIGKKDWTSAEQLATVARDALSGTGADMAEGRFFFGHLNMSRGKLDAAVIDLRAGLEKRRIFSTGWRLLGEALLGTQEIDSAIDAFQTALKQRPDSIQSLIGLAAAYDQRGETDRALAALQQANEYQPHNYRVKDTYLRYQLQHGDPLQVISLRRNIKTEDPANMANRRALVRALMAAEELKQAAAELKTIVDEEGETLDNIVASASVLFETHGADTAAAYLTNYLKNQGEEATPEDYVRVARILLEINKEEVAFSVYRQGISAEDSEQRPVTRELAGRLLQYPERASEAVELFKDLWHSSNSDLQIGMSYIQALVQTSQLDEAETMLEQVAKVEEDNVSIRILRAQIASLRGRSDDAITEIDRAIEKTPKAAMLYLSRAELLASNSTRLNDALADLDKALELNPTLTKAQRLKANIYRARGEFNTAIREFESLIRRAPTMKEARIQLISLYAATGQMEALKNLLSKSEDVFPTDATWPRQQAMVAIREDELGTALKKMKRAFDLESTPEILFDLVRLQLQTDKPNEALTTLRSNMEMIEDAHLLQALRGRAILMTQSRREAMEVFKIAVALTDNLEELVQTTTQISPALNFKGVAKLTLDSFEAPVPLWVELCVANLEQRAADHDASVMRLMPLESQVTELNEGERAFYYHTFSLALHMTNRFSEARDAYEKFLALRPDNPMMLNNMAYIVSEHLADPKAGIEYAEKALKLQPQNPMIMDTLGWACFLANDYVRAMQVLQEATDLHATGMTCLHLAEVYIKMEQESLAVEWLYKARKLATKEHDSETLDRADVLLDQLNPS